MSQQIELSDDALADKPQFLKDKERKRKAGGNQEGQDQALSKERKRKKKSRREENYSANVAGDVAGGVKGSGEAPETPAGPLSEQLGEAQAVRKKRKQVIPVDNVAHADGTTEAKDKRVSGQRKGRVVKGDADTEMGDVNTKASAEQDERSAVAAYVYDSQDSRKKRNKDKKDRTVSSQDVAESSLVGKQEKKHERSLKLAISDSPMRSVKQPETPYPDPSEDTSLSDQAGKALSYAYVQAVEPSSWKFNKAKQNWLVRNYWSEEAIPEIHLPVVQIYLGKVQGGVRETLLQTCRSTLSTIVPDATVLPAEAPTHKTSEAVVESTPAAVLTPIKVDSLKRKRAEDLLSILLRERKY